MSNQAAEKLMAMMSGNQGQIMNMANTESQKWHGKLMPKENMEDAPFSLEKYTHTSTGGSYPRFVIIMDKITDDIFDIERKIESAFLNSDYGKAIEDDIKHEANRWIVCKSQDGVGTAKEGQFVNVINGAYVDMPLGKNGEIFDIHYLDKDGNPAKGSDNNVIQPAKARTTEKMWLNAKELRNFTSSVEKFQNAVKKNNNRYREILINDSNESTVPPVV